MEPLKKLDTVLAWFVQDLSNTKSSTIVIKDVSAGYILKNIKSINTELKNDPDFHVEFQSILDQLEEDGYIMPNNKGLYTENLYTVTFKGKVFSSNGGYRGLQANIDAQRNRVLSLENHQKHHRNWMTLLTVILAVGTSVAALYYLVQLGCTPICSISILTIFFLILSCIAASLIIWLLVKEIRK